MEPENNIFQEINAENEFYAINTESGKISHQSEEFSVFVKQTTCRIEYDTNKNLTLKIDRLVIDYIDVMLETVIPLRIFVGKKIEGYKFKPVK